MQLRKWADFMVIAPLSANTLAKLANGLCDNLLVSRTLCSRVMTAHAHRCGIFYSCVYGTLRHIPVETPFKHAAVSLLDCFRHALRGRGISASH